ncbi:MAG: lipoyl(octanoyl) transferase LipB [Saprospiraceae bacterium]|nr:lipoyl(octanoyl) transferase LipB [Saprospiraceae bacterium]
MKKEAFKIQYHFLKDAGYKNAWDYQTLLHNEIKLRKFNSLKIPANKVTTLCLNHLIFCEHTPVITMGKSGKDKNLVNDENILADNGIEFFRINRGGDITYHGPGQITGYLIFDLELLYRDVHKFVRTIEECIIELLLSYGLTGFRLDGLTGVWLKHGDMYRKICAIGVHLSRWVSMHGFAFNVNTNLDHFRHIIPCGIEDADKEVTSLEKELGYKVDLDEVAENLKGIIAHQFDAQLLNLHA